MSRTEKVALLMDGRYRDAAREGETARTLYDGR
jgi:hypothetical protein